MRAARPTPRGSRVVLAFLLALHLAVLASVLSQSRPIIWQLHNDCVHRVGKGADFFAIYHAAVNVDRGRSPYDTNLEGITPYFYRFRYLPLVAHAARPFLLFPPRLAHRLWMGLLEALLAVYLVVLWRRVEPASERLWAAGALLLASPYFLELYMGQFTFAATTLVVLSLLAPGGPFTYSASVWLKVFPLASAPALLRHRRTRRHLALASGTTLLFSAPYFLTHGADWALFYESNRYATGGMHSGNYGFVYLLYLLAEDLNLSVLTSHWEAFTTVFRLVALAATALVVLLARDDRLLLGAVVMLLAHFLSYPHIWEHHTSGILLLGTALLTVPFPGRCAKGLLLASLVCLALPTPFLLLDQVKNPKVFDPATDWARWERYALLLPKVLPTLTLYILCLATVCRSGFQSAPALRHGRRASPR